MTREEIETAARALIAEHLKVPLHKVTDDARFVDDLGADSLDLIEISMLFEDAWDIHIPDEDAEAAKTVGQAVNFLANKLGVGTAVAA